MKYPLKAVVHRFYSMLYFLTILIGWGIPISETPLVALVVHGSLLLAVVAAHWYQIKSITPQTLLEYENE